MTISVATTEGFIDPAEAAGLVNEFFGEHDYSGKRLLLIVPDNTRSGPVGDLFQMIYKAIGQKAQCIDVLIALGTHPPMSEEQICTRLSISLDERRTTYGAVKMLNHEWDKPETFTTIGKITADRIEQISDGLFREEVDVSINKMIFDYDEFFILGPVFPHEVVGFSGGHKYIFPGISGDEIIHFFHWLGAVITNCGINGNKWTATRQVVEDAASFIEMPRKLFGLVTVDNKFKGLFIGEVLETWEQAADLSEKVHMVFRDTPYHTVLGIAAKLYDDIWTAGKVMYKLEPVVADGGTLIIYAPHITEVSYTHGKILDQVGYHVRDYFLKRMDKFREFPRGVLAHSTHVKGIGTYLDGIENPRINVILATGISQERCERINLGYRDYQEINISDYEDKEDEGILLVRHAGEMLYRLSDGSIPGIPHEKSQRGSAPVVR